MATGHNSQVGAEQSETITLLNQGVNDSGSRFLSGVTTPATSREYNGRMQYASFGRKVSPGPTEALEAMGVSNPNLAVNSSSEYFSLNGSIRKAYLSSS